MITFNNNKNSDNLSKEIKSMIKKILLTFMILLIIIKILNIDLQIEPNEMKDV